MKSIKSLFGIVFVLLILGGAYVYTMHPSLFKPKPPEFKAIENVKISDISGETASLFADVELHNPNWFSVNLSQVKMNINFKGKTIGVIDKEYDLKIPSEDSFKVPLNINFSLSEIQEHLLSTLMNIFGSKKKPEIHFEGSITVSSYGFPLTIPIDRKEEIDIKL